MSKGPRTLTAAVEALVGIVGSTKLVLKLALLAGAAAAGLTVSSARPALAGVVDFSIEIAELQPSYIAGGAAQWQITVGNFGPDAGGGLVTATVSPILANQSWVCLALPGAACDPSGLGDISEMVMLAASSQAVFILEGLIDIAATGPLIVNASIVAIGDTEEINNFASVTETIVPFQGSSVPEPGTVLLLGCGLVGWRLADTRRRRGPAP